MTSRSMRAQISNNKWTNSIKQSSIVLPTHHNWPQTTQPVAIVFDRKNKPPARVNRQELSFDFQLYIPFEATLK